MPIGEDKRPSQSRDKELSGKDNAEDLS